MFKIVFAYDSCIDANRMIHSFDYGTEENCYNFNHLSEKERFDILENELSSMVDDLGVFVAYRIEKE